MLSLLLATGFFVGIHLFVAGTRLRDRLVSTFREIGYMGLFSLASLGGIVWMCMAYARAPHQDVWGQLHGLAPVAWLLMALAFLFTVVGITTPNPTAVGADALLRQAESVRGAVRISRHPFLWGVAIWAGTHLILNGDLASIIFFGGFFVLALLGTRSIDAKRARLAGAGWEAFTAVTSNVPFAAIVEGRNRFEFFELGLWRVGLAVVLYLAVFHFHMRIFGASPV